MTAPADRIQPERVTVRSDAPVAHGRYVLYWMQQSQRAADNHALEYAAQQANERGLPLVVGFGLTAGYPGANRRHFHFLLEGLRETARAVEQRGARFVLRLGDPADVAIGLAAEAALVVCDRGYLRHQRAWRDRVAREAGRRVVEVESDAVVPVEVASSKREYAARTIRPKIRRKLREYLVPLASTPLRQDGAALDLARVPLADLDALDGLLDRLGVDGSVPPVPQHFPGGAAAARARFRRFLDRSLARYAEDSNQPQTESVSGMSPYLHFGQVSPLALALEVAASPLAADEGAVAFLEQLLVRRELSLNYCWFEPRYDAWDALPAWARATLTAHRTDRRAHVYGEAQLEAARTHDPYWNAAMEEMKVTGSMHNYMRMYWGKKILEWTADPAEALAVTLRLDDRWFLDGRDPNSVAGVQWIYGLHDRPWQEREVFGTVRTMTAAGLERKCDIRGYVGRVQRLAARG